MDKYEPIERIAAGSYGVLHKCRDRKTNAIVALKSVMFKNKDETVPASVMREISLLKELDHSNIIRLLDVVTRADGVDLVFEYMQYDLKKFIACYSDILSDRVTIRTIMHQLFRGVAHCHSQKVIHGDMRANYVLVDANKHIVKIAHFRMARDIFIPPTVSYTDKVAIMAYQAPEILLRSKYTTAMDVWSLGIIFAEMVTLKCIILGSSETQILTELFSLLGVPNDETWPGVTSICGYNLALAITISQEETSPKGKTLADVVGDGLNPDGFDLLSKMLCWNPRNRISAADALMHPYFKEEGC